MKFVNLRNRNRQPTVLVIKHPYVQFKIDSMTCDLKKGVLKVDSNETEVVQHITLAFVTATLYLLVQPRPPVLPPHWDKPWEKRGPKAVIFFNYIFSELNVLSQWARKLKKVQAKKLVNSHKSKNFFHEIAFLAVSNNFPVQKLIFGHF